MTRRTKNRERPGDFKIGYFPLRRLCDELRDKWLGAKICSACITSSADLYLSADDNRVLFLSGRSRQGRIADIPTPPPHALQSPSWVTRYVVGSAIRKIQLIAYEPIIEIDLVRRDSSGAEERDILIVELMGGWENGSWQNNLFLVAGENGEIIASLGQSAGSPHRTDKRIPGDIYSAPSAAAGTAPPDLTLATLEDILDDGDAATNLADAVSGMDPLVSQELLSLTGVDSSSDTGSLQPLLDAIRHLYQNPPWAEHPAIVNARGVDEICVIDLKHVEVSKRTEFDTVSQAIVELARRDQSRVEYGDRVEGIRRRLKKLVSSADRRIKRIRSDVGITEPAAKSGNSARKHSGKGHKARLIARRRMEDVEKERSELVQAIEILDDSDTNSLEELQTDWTERGWLLPEEPEPSSTISARQLRRYRTADGWTVLVGRNSEENDELTGESADDDLFFHAKGFPGSHVILKREGKANEPGKAAIEEAAALAAYWSKARRSGETVPVSYTAIRHVSKPSGAAPGLVTIQNEKTIFVSPREIPKVDI